MPIFADPVGGNIARIRNRLGMTQEQLSERSGVSVAAIRASETGVSAPRMTTLRKLADALCRPQRRVTTSDLLGIPSQISPADVFGQDDALMALRRILTPAATSATAASASSAEGHLPADVHAGGVDLEELRASLVAARDLYDDGEFAQLLVVAPQLVAEAHAAVRDRTGGDTEQAYAALAVAYQAAGYALVQVHHEDLAAQAFTLGADAATAGGHTLIAAMSAHAMGWVFQRQRRLGDSVRHCIVTADEVEPRSLRRATRPELAIWGNLLISAAAASVRNNQLAEAEEQLEAARAAAVLHGEDAIDDDLNSGFARGFGVNRVAIMAAEVATCADQHHRALDLGRQVRGGAVRATIWRRHQLDMALSHTQVGEAAAAVQILKFLYDEAPQWFTYQHLSKDITRTLIATQVGRLPDVLVDLADGLAIPL